MADIVDKKTRSRMMSGIRSRDTKIEIEVRHALHALGLRYRLGGSGLPGRPDLVFPRHSTVVFINGCFWHGHNCHLFRLPKTNSEFWLRKIEGNRERDLRVDSELSALGWKPIHIWECELRGKSIQERERRIRQLKLEITN